MSGTDNPLAFAKLREVVMLHFAIRERAAEAVGQPQTTAIEAQIIERLKAVFPGMGELAPELRDAWKELTHAQAGLRASEV